MNQENTKPDASLRKILFDQMHKLASPTADLEKELQRAHAMAKVGKVLVDSSKVQLDFMRLHQQQLNGKKNPNGSKVTMLPYKKQAKRIGNG